MMYITGIALNQDGLSRPEVAEAVIQRICSARFWSWYIPQDCPSEDEVSQAWQDFVELFFAKSAILYTNLQHTEPLQNAFASCEVRRIFRTDRDGISLALASYKMEDEIGNDCLRTMLAHDRFKELFNALYRTFDGALLDEGDEEVIILTTTVVGLVAALSLCMQDASEYIPCIYDAQPNWNHTFGANSWGVYTFESW